MSSSSKLDRQWRWRAGRDVIYGMGRGVATRARAGVCNSEANSVTGFRGTGTDGAGQRSDSSSSAMAARHVSKMREGRVRASGGKRVNGDGNAAR